MTKDAVKSFTDPLRRIRGLESVTEKLFHNATIAILVFLFVLLASKPLFGSSISCQVPKDWPEASVGYYTDLCYYGRRENIGFKQNVSRGKERGHMVLNTLTGTSDTYMWIPFMPILHGALCLIPVFFWKFVGLDSFNGLDIVTFLEFFEMDKDREILMIPENWRVEKLAAQFHEWITKKTDSMFGLSRTMFLYVLMKWFRFFIFTFQLWIIAYFFGDRNLYWGYNSVIDIAQGRTVNKLQGEFTLISGCKVERFTMGIDGRKEASNVHTAHARCMLSANFMNAKAFLFLYWWFLFVSVISFCSAIHHTLILFVPFYRKYEMSSMIRNENYYIERCGEPHPDLQLASASPTDHFIEYLGNDGYLVVRMIHDMLHGYACDRFIEYVWVHKISNNGKAACRKQKSDDSKGVSNTEMDGSGDRHRGGFDHPEKNTFSSTAHPNDSVSCAKFSLSKESQPSLMLSESDEEPLISPSILNSMS